MQIRETISRIRISARNAALRFLTPNEYYAVLAFLGLGAAVLLYRGGKVLWYLLYPASQPASYLSHTQRTDSIFAALSAASMVNDSTVFYDASSDERSLAGYESRVTSKTKVLPQAGSVSLNKATQAELMQLPGVGEVMSQRIIEYRTQRGSFRSLNELTNVHGIGRKKFEQMKIYLRLD